MPKPVPIRLLAPLKQNGDLLTDLVAELLVAQGALFAKETQQYEVEIPYAYRIARYPVTVAQYREYLGLAPTRRRGLPWWSAVWGVGEIASGAVGHTSKPSRGSPCAR